MPITGALAIAGGEVLNFGCSSLSALVPADE
jgi:hypothetical protein